MDLNQKVENIFSQPIRATLKKCTNKKRLSDLENSPNENPYDMFFFPETNLSEE